MIKPKRARLGVVSRDSTEMVASNGGWKACLKFSTKI